MINDMKILLNKPTFFKDQIQHSTRFITLIDTTGIKGCLSQSSPSDFTAQPSPPPPDQDKKRLLNVSTEAVSLRYVFTDTLGSQKKIYNFQKLINNSFNTAIKNYLTKNSALFLRNGIRPKQIDDLVIFMYKGGTTMKILYDKFMGQLVSEPTVYDFYVRYFADKFQRSDSDYSIVINKKYFPLPGKGHYSPRELEKINLYNLIYKDMNIICSNILNQIRDIQVEDIKLGDACEYLPLHLITEENLRIMLENLNKEAKTTRDFNNYQFVGLISPLNEYYETRPETFVSIHGSIDSGLKAGTSSTTLPKILEKGKKDSIITAELNVVDNQYYGKYCNITSDNKPIYLSINELNRYLNRECKTTEFCLQRLKIQFRALCKTPDDKLCYLDIPSELVDISIGKFNDFKIVDTQHDIVPYHYISKGRNLDYIGYSLNGFIHDLLITLFESTQPYPWQEPKYNKKLARICFMMLYLLLLETKSNLLKYKLFVEKFKTLLFAKNITVWNYQAIKRLNTYFIKNQSLQNIVDRFYNLRLTVESLKDDNITENYNKMVMIIIDCLGGIGDNIDKIRPSKISSEYNQVDKLKKYYSADKDYKQLYLKYKNKYLKLKELINKN